MIASLQMAGRDIVVTGGLVKTARLRDEEWQEDAVEPEAILHQLGAATSRPDLFTFVQTLTDPKPRYSYVLEWDNLAVIPITTYEDWWENRVPQETRKNVRRAAKRQLVVQSVRMDESLARGIKEIYDETPVRQGRRYHHYGKELATVLRENSSYLERSEFIGAYYGEELVGFLKMVSIGSVYRIMQIVSQVAHQDRRPTNALLAKAVEICVQKKATHFVYGRYIYGKNTSSPLIDFKRRNGFEQQLVPRYYIPLTALGKLSLRCHAHRGVRALMPERVDSALLWLRSQFLQRQLARN